MWRTDFSLKFELKFGKTTPQSEDCFFCNLCHPDTGQKNLVPLSQSGSPLRCASVFPRCVFLVLSLRTLRLPATVSPPVSLRRLAGRPQWFLWVALAIVSVQLCPAKTPLLLALCLASPSSLPLYLQSSSPITPFLFTLCPSQILKQ